MPSGTIVLMSYTGTLGSICTTSPWSRALSPIELPAGPQQQREGRGLFDRQIDKTGLVIVHLLVDRGTLLIADNTHNCRPSSWACRAVAGFFFEECRVAEARMAACRASFGGDVLGAL